MPKFSTRYSLRTLLFVAVVTALAIAIGLPVYRRSLSPLLTDARSVIVKSNTRFPVVSTRTYYSGPDRDRARILLMHRRTKAVPEKNWGPHWNAGMSLADAPMDKCVVDGHRIYPSDDERLIVIFASDDESPVMSRVPYGAYARIPWDDTDLLWDTFAKPGQSGG